MTALCMSQKALRVIRFTSAAFSVCGINHNITVLTEQDDKAFLSTEPKRAKGQNQFIRVIGLMFLISYREIHTEGN